jgi:hypothetical protein
LESQLNRLDTVIDGLAENLHEVVAMATANVVRETLTVVVQEAVRGALVEILANAEVQKRLAATQEVSVPLVVRLAAKVNSCWSWLASTAKCAWSKVSAMATAYCGKVKKTADPVVTAAGVKVHKAREQVARCTRSGWMLASALAALGRRYRKQLAVAIGVGVLVGVVCYVGGREIASIGCGLAGFVGSLTSDTLKRLRRLLPHWLPSTS